MVNGLFAKDRRKLLTKGCPETPPLPYRMLLYRHICPGHSHDMTQLLNIKLTEMSGAALLSNAILNFRPVKSAD